MSLGLPASGDSLVEAWTGQPSLFSGLDLSTETVAAARSFLHSGKTTSNDEQAAAKIVAAASLGWSVRKIARELNHSRNTIAAVLRLAEKAGKVEPVKDRVLAAAAEAIHQDIELGNEIADQIREGRAGERALSELAALRRGTWVGAGILADKGALAAGPGLAVTVNVGAGSVVQVVQEYASRIKALADSKSGVNTPETAQNATFPGQVMPLLTPPGTPIVDLEPAAAPDPGPSPNAQARDEADGRARANGGAGGVERAAAPPVSEP